MKKHKKLIIIFIILATLLAGYFALANYSQNPNNDDASVNIDEDSTILPDIKQNDQTDDSTNNDNQQTDDSSEPDPKQNDPQDNTNDTTELPVPAISRADATVVKAFVNTTKNGSCQLLLTGPKTITKTNPTVHQPNYRQCEDFNFKEGELQSGDWTAKVRFKFNGEFSEYSDPYPFKVK